MNRPLYSVLIPSRNRLDLLRLAVDSAFRQDADLEIVFADNALQPGYSQYVGSLGRVAERLVRSSQSLTVTENWNRAIDVATGRYVVMLGDDDALAPGWPSKATELMQCGSIQEHTECGAAAAKTRKGWHNYRPFGL